MDPFWQVVIGTAIGGLLVNLFWFFKHYLEESNESGEKQTLAIWSIVLGLAGVVTLGITSVIGLVLALVAIRGKKHKALSISGLIISILTLLPWLAVIAFGP